MNIIKELKKENKEKELFNFKIDADLLKKFKLKCKKNDLKYSRVLTALIEEFLK